MGRTGNDVTFGSLFAGIGGFDLGFERAGMRCVWQVEIDDYCRRVLAKHWPDVRRWDDVRTWPQPDTERPDVICGGFPCQDISQQNPNAQGIDGARSGLWSEYIRIIRTIQPAVVCVENVSALLVRGLDRLLRDIATSGYDAEWQTLPAQAFGAPHGRDRVFVVAYRASKRRQANELFDRRSFEAASQKSTGRIRWWTGEPQPRPSLQGGFRWCPDRQLCRVVDGLPDQLDRYRGLGNAVVPQVAEWIGRRIMETA